MDTLQKIEYLNKKCKDSLSITHYYGTWELHSYKEGTPLCKDIYHESLDGLLDKAIRKVEKASK